MPHALPSVVAVLLDARDDHARQRAWAAFLSEYNKLILHVCHARGGDYDAVMDRYAFVVEQLQRDAGRRLAGYDANGSGKFTTWLTVVLRRLCLDEHRHRYGRRQTEGRDSEHQEAVRRDLADLVAASLEDVQLPDGARLPDADAAARELRDVLNAALSALSDEDRLILRFRYEQELSVPEIARLAGFDSPFRLYRHIDKLLDTLRRELSRAGITGSGTAP